MELQGPPPDESGRRGGRSLGRGMGFVRRRGEHWTRFAARVANAFGLVLLLTVTTYVLGSLTTYTGWSAFFNALVASLTAVVGLVSSEARPALVRAGGAVAAVAVVLAALFAIIGGSGLLGASTLLVVTLLAFTTVTILAAVLREQEVGFRTILGAISVYVMVGLLYTFLYAALDRFQAGLFFGTPVQTGDYVFFSITTLTTTGYGNLVPAGQPGKMFSGLEMLTGQIFLVTLIAGLVSLWRPGAAVEKLRR
jgi:ion channel